MLNQSLVAPISLFIVLALTGCQGTHMLAYEPESHTSGTIEYQARVNSKTSLRAVAIESLASGTQAGIVKATKPTNVPKLTQTPTRITSRIKSLSANENTPPTITTGVAMQSTKITPNTINRATGELAPDFSVRLFNGETLLLSDLKGYLVVLNFWASWCAPCRSEMPAFQGVWQEYRDKGVIFLGIASRDSKKAAENFASEIGVSYPLTVDGAGEIAVDYKVLRLPTTVLIDRDGNEIRRFGIANEGYLRFLLDGHL